mgnify:CR=1 FL=1
MTGAVEIALIFLLVPRGGYLVGAAIFSTYLVVSVCLNIMRGLAIIKREEAVA